jgi:hypothetical protein
MLLKKTALAIRILRLADLGKPTPDRDGISEFETGGSAQIRNNPRR